MADSVKYEKLKPPHIRGLISLLKQNKSKNSSLDLLKEGADDFENPPKGTRILTKINLLSRSVKAT